LASACCAFSVIADLESKILMDGGNSDLSENSAKECTWGQINNYQAPAGTCWGSCDGGNSEMVANLLTQKGAMLESCDPYQSWDTNCKTTCTPSKVVLD